MNILIHEGHLKVHWLLALAAGETEELNLLPADFPPYKLNELAKAFGVLPSTFSNWFPVDPTKRKTLARMVNRPPVEVARNIARIFGFAPTSDDGWSDWWEKDWPSFMPSEVDGTNRQHKEKE